MPNKYINCPYCGEAWSVPEVQDQECYECGYPNPVIDPEDALKTPDMVPELCDTVGGLTPFSRMKVNSELLIVKRETGHRLALHHSQITNNH